MEGAPVSNPETAIQREVVNALERAGCRVFRLNAGGYRQRVRLCPPGTPDLLCVPRRGPAIWMEVKRPGELTSDAQNEMLNELTSRGQRCWIVHGPLEALGALEEETNDS